MKDFHLCKLGRTPARRDPRTLQLKNYIRPQLLPFPEQRLWQTAIDDWGVMGNEAYGNCVIATAAHAILSWQANETGDKRRITDSAVIDLSREMGALDGYAILDRLKYWRKIGMWANDIWAFAAIKQGDETEIRIAVNEFGAADIGINLPNAWKSQDIWTTGHGRQYEPGSWGGHSVPIVGYDPTGVYVVTWGEIVRITWQALPVYCDEAYACIDPIWISRNAKNPAGIDLTTLHADLQAITKDKPFTK